MTSVFKSVSLACKVLATPMAAFGLCASAAQVQHPANPPANHAAHPVEHAVGHKNTSAFDKRTVLPFDEKTWAQALLQGPRPAAYLFTTSYCSTCPAAFAVLYKAVQDRKNKPELNAVMMDVAGSQALRHAAHFKGMTRLYAFDGFEPAIRQAVDPGWPNVTPYVVLVDAQGQMQRVIGPPSPAMLKRWLLLP